MKGKTYFTEVASMDPHFIVAGHTDDLVYNDMLQQTSVEFELHRHLKEQGFEAVVFYNRTLKIYTYDRRSLDIVRGTEASQTQEEVQTLREADYVDLRTDGPLGMDFDEIEEEPQERATPVEAPSNEIFCMRRVDPIAAWQMIVGMLRGERKTALVISNMNAMTYRNEEDNFPPDALQVLTELGEISSRNHSIAVYIFRGMDFAELERQTIGAEDNWERFMHSHIRPLICRNGSLSRSKNDGRHVIRVDIPNAAHVRNLLLHLQLREHEPLNIRSSDIEPVAIHLAYGCGCAKTPITIKALRNHIEAYVKENPKFQVTPDNCHLLIGRKNNNTAMEDMQSLIGLDDAKKRLEKVFDYAQKAGFKYQAMPEDFSPFAPMQASLDFGMGLNVCLMGEPGTGKTEIAGLLGRIFYEAGVLPTTKLIALRPSDIIRGGVGETGRRMAEEIQRAMGGVLFIDEAYGLSEEESLGSGAEAITQLVGDMTAYKGKFAVVLAGYEDRMRRLISNNEGLRSRFLEENYYHLNPYTPKEIMEILRVMANKDEEDVSFVPDTEENGNWLENFCENWVGDRSEEWGNAREAERLLIAMKQNCAQRTKGDKSQVGKYLLSRADIPEKFTCHLRPRSNGLAEAFKKLDNDYVGLETPKKFLKNLCATIKWDKQVPEPGNYMFMGPPGTGKTFFAESMCEILNLMELIRRRTPVKYNAGDLINGTVTVEDMVKRARGTLLFIDEAHQLCDTEAGRRAIRQLVPILDDPEVRADTCFVLAGYQDELMRVFTVDSGLESRFEKKNRIRFVNYTAEELVKILETFVTSRGFVANEGYLNRSLVALGRKLETVDRDFGNARYIRKEYIDNSIARRTKRLNRTYITQLPEEEREFAVPDDSTVAKVKDSNVLTELDIPEDMERFAGPLGMPPQPPRTAETRLAELVGKTKVKEYIEAFKASRGTPEFFDSESENSMHFVIAGPPGSGRHTVARLLAGYLYEAGKLSNERPISRSKGDFEGEFVGSTVPKTQNVIEGARGNMMIVENPSSMLPKNGYDNTYGVEALATLVGAMDSSDLSIVFIDTVEGIDSLIRSVNGIRDRAKSFELEDLSPAEMQEIFTQRSKNSFCFDEELQDLISSFFLNWVSDRGGLGEKTSAWGNGSELDSLLDTLRENWVRMGGEKIVGEDKIPRRQITKAMFPEEMQKYLISTIVSHKTALDELKNMTGLDNVWRAVSKISRRLKRADKSCSIPGCYCFLGNPGTGKTTVARMLGGVLKATGILSQGHVIERSAASFADNPNLYNEGLKLAKNGILFIDEAHQMLQTSGGQEVIHRLVRDLEDLNVLKSTSIVLAGYPAEMRQLIAFDKGLKRRFGSESSIIRFPDYTPEQLVEILEKKAKNAAKEPQIGAPCEIKLSPEFVNASHRIFARICATKKADFGNAGFVRNYLGDAVDCLLERLDDADEIEYYLTESDIPAQYRILIEEKRLPAALPAQSITVEPTMTSMSEADMKKATESMTVYLKVFKNGQPIGSGTGTIITSTGHILTCAHVVADADRVQAKLYCPNNIGAKDFFMDCKILSPIASDIDMALLKIDGEGYPAASLRRANEGIDSTERIMLAGYSLGSQLTHGDDLKLRPSYKFGRVSSIQNPPEFAVERYYSDITGLHGDSGGPIFSMEDGRLIGVFVGSVTPGKGSLDELNFFHPIHAFWNRFIEFIEGE